MTEPTSEDIAQSQKEIDRRRARDARARDKKKTRAFAATVDHLAVIAREIRHLNEYHARIDNTSFIDACEIINQFDGRSYLRHDEVLLLLGALSKVSEKVDEARRVVAKHLSDPVSRKSFDKKITSFLALNSEDSASDE